MNPQPQKPDLRRSLAQIAVDHPPSRYLDHKDFLENLRLQAKAERGRYTFEQFSNDLGFSSASTAYMVTKGHRPFSPRFFATVQKSLRLPTKEKKFLRILIDYTQAKQDHDRESAFQQMIRLKESIVGRSEGRFALKFYQSWLNAAIFEMVGLPGFREMKTWIAERLYPKTKPEDIAQSIDLLESIGLLSRDENGRLRKTKASVSTPKEVEGLAVAGFHNSMLNLSRASLSEVPASERHVSALTLTFTDATFERVKNDIELFRDYLKFLSEKDGAEAERVAQVNFQLFALTRPVSEGDPS